MKRMKMDASDAFTFEDGCNKYLDNCRQRNLREGSINQYKQSYKQFYKFFDPETPILLPAYTDTDSTAGGHDSV